MKKGCKMNFETIMSFIGIIVIPFLGFLYKEANSLKKDLADYKKEVAEKYAPREELVRIEDKIDRLTQLVIERLPKGNNK